MKTENPYKYAEEIAEDIRSKYGAEMAERLRKRLGGGGAEGKTPEDTDTRRLQLACSCVKREAAIALCVLDDLIKGSVFWDEAEHFVCLENDTVHVTIYCVKSRE